MCWVYSASPPRNGCKGALSRMRQKPLLSCTMPRLYGIVPSWAASREACSCRTTTFNANDTTMKGWMQERKSYICPQSRDRRQGLRPSRYGALLRQNEAMASRFAYRAGKLLVGPHRRILRRTDPTIFFESHFIPRPEGSMTFFFKKHRTAKQIRELKRP